MTSSTQSSWDMEGIFNTRKLLNNLLKVTQPVVNTGFNADLNLVFPGERRSSRRISTLQFLTGSVRTFPLQRAPQRSGNTQKASLERRKRSGSFYGAKYGLTFTTPTFCTSKDSLFHPPSANFRVEVTFTLRARSGLEE